MSDNDNLRGPWKAYIVQHGEVYGDETEIDLDVLADDDEVDVVIVRGSALPDGEGRMPDTHYTSDVAFERRDVYVEGEDGEPGARQLFARALAMAAGLNAAASAPAVTVERPDDEHIEIHVNGQVVASANYDEHGWSGMDAVEKTALSVARAFGAGVSA